MPSPQQRQTRQKIVNSLAVVLVLSLLMSWSSSNPERLLIVERIVAEALHPLQVAGNAVAGFFVSSWHFVVDIGNVYSENQRLRELVEEYRGIEHQLAEVRLTNQRLRALLDFKEEVEMDLMPAQVVGRNPSTWFSTVTIDKGSRDGVQVDMPVVTHQGLVGKTIRVYPTHAVVLLLISPDSGISAIVQRTRDNGVLTGVAMPSGYCKLTRLPANSEVKEGDVIISSSLTGIYPKGLVIGRVVEVEYDPITLERSALVRPEVDFERLEEVLLVISGAGDGQ